MNKRQIFLIVPILLLASCQREMDVPDQFKAPDITAEIQAETRTVLSVDESGAGTIYWKTADQIDVFIGENKLVYTSQNSSNAATATFKTNDGLGGNYPDSEPILAIYPSYEESYINEWGDRLVCSYLPSQQYGLPGTFDDDLFMAVATGTKQNMGSSTPLSFHNICSGLKFSLSRDDITCVKFRGTDTSYGDPVVLAGDVFFEFDGAWSGSSSGATEITLYPESGSTFQKDAYYYIICFPASLRDFYVDFETTSGASATLRGTEYNLARGVLIDEPFEFRKSIFMKKTHIDEYAKFSDEDVPHTQIKYWTSGRPDSIWQNAPEGGYYEWFGVEPFQNESVFDKNDGIGYGEFRFNSAVTRIGPSLFKNSNLTQIHLPMSITEIGSSAFEGSSSLTYLSVPQSLISIGSRAFYGCSSLESRSLSIPDSVTSIGDGAFAGCSSILSFFGKFASSNGLYLIDSGKLIAVAGGSMIGDVIIPDDVSSIGDYAYYTCDRLTSITLHAVIPPVIGSGVFDDTNDCPIYVPAGSVAAYKSAWSEYADRIQPNVEAVDLGLSVKWATCNVGASSPEDYGDYFAWGETSPKSGYYEFSTYSFWDGNNHSLTKYNVDENSGIVDNKTLLDSSDDAAYVNWGNGWRIPTMSEIRELYQQCSWVWTTQGGNKGYRVTSKINGNSIFLPAAGIRNDLTPYYLGANGRYWSMTYDLNSPKYAYQMDFDSSSLSWGGFYRAYGLAVRPIKGVFVPVESVGLNISTLDLEIGQTSVLYATVSPANASEKTVSWFSDNPSVATVDFNGVVTAVSPGTSIILVRTNDGLKVASCTVTVDHEWVDLGLPSGLKWATCNVGASSPEEYGDYFAWGETNPKSSYSWTNYKYRASGSTDDNVTFSKYNTKSGRGTIDNKTCLDYSDDAARSIWGGDWRMPTGGEISELRSNCDVTWTTQLGVNGCLLTSKINGKSVFFPAAGYKTGNMVDVGTSVLIRTSSLISDYPILAQHFYYNPSSNSSPSSSFRIPEMHVITYSDYNTRYPGLSIRAVK